MIFSTIFVVLSAAFKAVAAIPTKELVRRNDVLSGKTSSAPVMDGHYIVENNLWGMSSATSGWQDTQLVSVHGGSVAWQRTTAGLEISSIPTSWYWWQNPSASSALVADVSYDLWFSADRDSRGATESTSMIWLSSRGNATPAGKVVATANVNGVNWKLYKGTVKTWTVFSFVTPTETKHFNSDLKPFIDYLTSSQGVPSSHYLVQAQAGTEPFTGSAVFLTNAYSLSVN